MNGNIRSVTTAVTLGLALSACTGTGPKNETPPPVEPPRVVPVKPTPPPPPVVIAEPAAPRFALTDVNFEFDKASLTPSASSILDNAAAVINEFPAVRYRIDGHTDSIGSHAYNEDLSRRRASRVRDYLEARGVSRERMDVNAYGETRPIAPNDTAVGRAQNRRVDIEPIK